MKLGLLMEAAQSQQALATSALEHLRERMGELDSVVREEIRNTLIEELQELVNETDEPLTPAQATTFATFVFGLEPWLATLATAIPLGLAWWILPTPTELVALRCGGPSHTGIARL